MKPAALLFLCLLALAAGMKAGAAEPCYPPFATNYVKQSYPVNGWDCFDYPACFIVFSWHCDKEYLWRSTFKIVRASHFVPDALGEYKRFLAASFAEKLATDNRIFHEIDETDPEFGWMYPIAKLQRDATKPDPIEWKVKAYPQGTRPWFKATLVNGTWTRRSTKSGDIRIDQPCKCWSIVIPEGDSRMCDVSGVVAEPPTKLIPADHVALCVRQQ